MSINSTSSRSLTDAYTPSGVAAIATLFRGIHELTPAWRNTAARAVLRAMKSADDHRKTYMESSGLDQMHLELRGRGEARGQEAKEIEDLEKTTFRDLIDAISTFERMNGGITVVLHCPGYSPSAKLAAGDVTFDLYATPRELKAGGQRISEEIAFLAQSFGQNVARPHLQRFLSRCSVNAVTPPQLKSPGTLLWPSDQSYLPPAEGAIKGYMLCRSSPSSALSRAVAISRSIAASNAKKGNISQLNRVSYPDLRNFDDELSSDHERNATQYEEPPAVSEPNTIVPQATYRAKKAPRESTDDGFCGALISIGPETDAVLKQFGIQDAFIPRLRVLSQTVRSSQWQFKLRDPTYGLTFEQAVNVASAMEHDIMHKPGFKIRKVETSYTTLKTYCVASLLPSEILPFDGIITQPELSQIGSEQGPEQRMTELKDQTLSIL